ncbi:MAG: bifunctional UDP-sugar hydrolase/5'-nucleotidase [Negativicutes bacterium]
MRNKNGLTIIQINDSHAYLEMHQELFWQSKQFVYRPAGGFARMATLVNQIKTENPDRVLFCDCGDTIHGTYPAIATQGEIMVPILNALGIDAMTAHWEFAYGPKKFQELTAELNYPVLAINVYDKETRQTIFPPYLMKEINGLRIGIVGIASNIVDKTMPPHFSEGILFTNGKEELPAVINTLRTKENADFIVLVSHLGFPQDMELLAEIPGIDVCLSGHTHNRLFHPAKVGQTLVIQSGFHGSFLGRLDLDIENGVISDYRYRLIEIECGIEPDQAVDAMIQQSLAPYRSELSAVVGETATAINRGTLMETTMDNFLLQSLLESTGAQVAFSNGWRYGAPIIPGPITLNDLYNIIPMNPPVSTVELSGAEIWTMLEENLEKTFSRDPFRQMGGYIKRCLGLTAYFKIENPDGHRIQKLFIGDDEIVPEQYYVAAYVTVQGVPGKYGRRRENRAEKSIEAMQAYLTKHRPLYAELRGTFVAV